MGRRRRPPVWLGLLAAALLGAGATWAVLAGRIGRDSAGGDSVLASTPGGVATLEARVAHLERELESARSAPRPAEGLAAPPAPTDDDRRAKLERELAATQRKLAEALAERQAAAAAPSGFVTLGGGPDGEPIRLAFGGAAPEAEPQTPVDLAEAARLLRSDREEDRRLAYGMLARATGPDALGLLQEALGRDDVGSHASPLMQRAAALKDRAWSAAQAAGAPDTPIAGDNATAWAPKQQDMGEVTIDLEYELDVRVDEVRIRETFNPGAVVRVLAFEPGGGWDVLWEGVAPVEPAPRWFVPPVRRTTYATKTIRLVLDTNRVPGWNELDAVELVGDGRRQWAKGATASSSYAD